MFHRGFRLEGVDKIFFLKKVPGIDIVRRPSSQLSIANCSNGFSTDEQRNSTNKSIPV